MTTIVRREAPNSPKLSTKLVVYWADRMLAKVDRSEAELSVLLTDDETIRSLNRDYRKKDRPTDVLSFHFESMGATPLEAGWLLGDIVISLDTAARQAEGRKRSLEEEVRWLLAHGLLHLIGYDHAKPNEKKVMVAWTGKLVRAAGDIPERLLTEAKQRSKKTSKKPATRSPKAASPSTKTSTSKTSTSKTSTSKTSTSKKSRKKSAVAATRKPKQTAGSKPKTQKSGLHRVTKAKKLITARRRVLPQ